MRKYDVVTLIIFVALTIAVIFFLRTLEAGGEQITLTWDAPAQEHTGVKIFQKTTKDGDAYDYSSPVATVLYPANVATIDVPGEPDAVLKYQWIARAYRDDMESGNSNEVSYKVVNVQPLTPIELSGSYEDDIITLSWSQPVDEHPIDKWVVYYKNADGQFEAIGIVTDGSNLELSSDVSELAPIGQRTNMSFAVVAFRRSGVYSANSVELEIEIDRREVAPVQNLRIEIEIPL